MPFVRQCFLLVVILALLGVPAAAQDSNYWTLQHGNQARLLGGAVVGGSQDLSATFYNPGRLAQIEQPDLLLAGNVFEYTTLRIDGAVDGQTYSSARLGSVPSLFAGQIRGWSKGESQWAYSFLGRYNSQFRVDERRDLAPELDFDVDQAEASVSFDESMSEYWGGLTYARPLGDHVAIGATGYVAVRSQRSRTLIVAQIARADTAGTAGMALQRADFNYSHWSALAKIGISADLGDWQLGVAFTTPNLKVYGSGTVGFDQSWVSQDLDGDGAAPSQILTGYQKDVAADYHAAPSVSAGVSYDWDSTSLNFTGEWFASVSGYIVLDPAPVVSSDGSESITPHVTDARRSVLNGAVGLEHRFRPDLQGYVSFRTDFTSTKEQRDSQIAVSIWDIYHVGAGATFEALGTTFTLGFIYAFGGTETLPTVGLIPEGEGGEGEVELDQKPLKYRYRRITGLLGFSFGS